MNSVWSWYIIIGTVVSLLACLWLVAWTNRQRASEEEIKESESHVWDEDIRELNNPLPMWWLWLFVLTVIWGAGYLLYYPGLGNFAGVAKWSQEDQYDREIAAAEAAYGPMFASYGAMPVEELVKDPKALAIGASLFANYCSQCHGSTAQGARGFPDLTDGAWLWGGSPAQIEQSIVMGRTGVMPSWGAIFPDDESIDEMVRYVQAMADGIDTTSPAHGRYMTVCVACHGPTGGGNPALGSPSLLNDSWLYGSSAAAIRQTIVEGRTGVMPANRDLIGPDRARILAAYVYSLSQ